MFKFCCFCVNIVIDLHVFLWKYAVYALYDKKTAVYGWKYAVTLVTVYLGNYKYVIFCNFSLLALGIQLQFSLLLCCYASKIKSAFWLIPSNFCLFIPVKPMVWGYIGITLSVPSQKCPTLSRFLISLISPQPIHILFWNINVFQVLFYKLSHQILILWHVFWQNYPPF